MLMVCIVSLSFLWVTSVQAARKNTRQLEYRIKAVYLYNFLKFIDIPDKQPNTEDEPFKICVLEEDSLLSAITIIKEKTTKGRPLQVEQINSVNKAKQCHIVFIGVAKKHNLESTLNRLKRSGILTVSDMPEFAKKGGIIGFVIKRKKVRLEINLNAANREGLKISANLLEVATIINKEEH
ncbi:MAG: YfiR family protein [Magnetococcales bacterium]|nr:YfiR family protein [Magnetococcales bacterium]